MARVNFYLLRHDDAHARLHLACRLSEQLLRQGLKVRLLATHEDEARTLDQLLWTFSAESFVPHALQNTAPAACSVLIDWHLDAFTGGNLLNLTAELPPQPALFDSIAEFVLNNDAAKALSRRKWNAYKQGGHELRHHQV
ncbi:MAG: DNA polymerase III subunit chi [Pseudomonadales bacterium]|nr:DNA polymerase III subunit chi [Pseudomonadales bacterium]